MLGDKVFIIAKNPKYDGYHDGLASLVYNFFDKKSSVDAMTDTNKSAIKIEIMQNQKLSEELVKPITKKIEKRKVHSFFKDNIWGAHLADM